MPDRRRQLTRQVNVRMDGKLFKALEEDARENGRTLAQSARFRLQQSLAGAK